MYVCMYVCILHLLRTNMSCKWGGKSFICMNRRCGIMYYSGTETYDTGKLGHTYYRSLSHESPIDNVNITKFHA